MDQIRNSNEKNHNERKSDKINKDSLDSLMNEQSK